MKNVAKYNQLSELSEVLRRILMRITGRWEGDCRKTPSEIFLLGEPA